LLLAKAQNKEAVIQHQKLFSYACNYTFPHKVAPSAQFLAIGRGVMCNCVVQNWDTLIEQPLTVHALNCSMKHVVGAMLYISYFKDFHLKLAFLTYTFTCSFTYAICYDHARFDWTEDYQHTFDLLKQKLNFWWLS